jgi:K+-sensing histidine kinase KdpD
VLEKALTSVWNTGVPASGVVVDARRAQIAHVIAAEAHSWVLAPRRSLTQVADLVASVSGDVGPALQGRAFTARIADCLPPVDVDVTLISRVLANLLHNAVRHSPKDSPIVLGARLTGPETVEVSVTDHGPGISPSRRDEIFTVFERQADDAGAGLGLTIAKTFIEAHEQRIWVEDAPAAARGSVSRCRSRQTSQRSGSLPRILIVNDDPDLGTERQSMGSHHGCSIPQDND